ncbi:hypothetical protein GCM10009084_07300 [Marinomonas primoryensis]
MSEVSRVSLAPQLMILGKKGADDSKNKCVRPIINSDVYGTKRYNKNYHNITFLYLIAIMKKFHNRKIAQSN